MKNCYFMKTKSRREKKRTFYCHCCRVCVVKGARRQKAATTSSAIVGLLRYVYMRIIWLIMPLLWLCEKGERSNLNSNKWFFFAHNFSSTWCIMVFKFVSEPELTRLLFCYRAEKEIVTVLFSSSFHQVPFRLPKCLVKGSHSTLRNRKKSSSFVIMSEFTTKGEKFFFSEANLRGLSRKKSLWHKECRIQLSFSSSDLRV